MTERYYLDTAIWIDICEDRKGYFGEDLADSPLKLLILIKTKKKRLVITDILIQELGHRYSEEEITGILAPFEGLIDRIRVNLVQKEEAKELARKNMVPLGDALHAIIARDNNLILVSRDNNFRKLRKISQCYKPEELI